MTTSTTGPPQSSSRGFIFAIIALVVVGLAIVALVASVSGDGDVDVDLADEQVGTVSLDGATLPALPQGVAVGFEDNDAVVGQTAPTLVATDFAGDEVSIGADGRPKVIYFVAHWCPHCQDEIPVVQGLIDAGAQPEDLDIYAVSTAVDEGRGNYPPQSWLAEEGFEPVVVRDDAAASAFSAYGGSAFPYAIYLDGDNQVVARAAGNLDEAATTDLWELTAATAG